MESKAFSKMKHQGKKRVVKAGQFVEVECYIDENGRSFQVCEKENCFREVVNPGKFSEWERVGSNFTDKIFKGSLEVFKSATETVSSTLNNATNGTKKFLDEKGITETVSNVTGAVDDGLDALSGKKILDLVEEHLARQAKYNDILATKLEEALQRIEVLEARLEREKA